MNYRTNGDYLKEVYKIMGIELSNDKPTPNEDPQISKLKKKEKKAKQMETYYRTKYLELLQQTKQKGASH